jgi:hypothetical protein
MATDIRTRIVRQVAEEWTREGRLHVPPDETEGDSELEFWSEVDRRLAGVPGPVHKQTPEEFQARMRDLHGD